MEIENLETGRKVKVFLDSSLEEAVYLGKISGTEKHLFIAEDRTTFPASVRMYCVREEEVVVKQDNGVRVEKKPMAYINYRLVESDLERKFYSSLIKILDKAGVGIWEKE